MPPSRRTGFSSSTRFSTSPFSRTSGGSSSSIAPFSSGGTGYANIGGRRYIVDRTGRVIGSASAGGNLVIENTGSNAPVSIAGQGYIVDASGKVIASTNIGAFTLAQANAKSSNIMAEAARLKAEVDKRELADKAQAAINRGTFLPSQDLNKLGLRAGQFNQISVNKFKKNIYNLYGTPKQFQDKITSFNKKVNTYNQNTSQRIDYGTPYSQRTLLSQSFNSKAQVGTSSVYNKLLKDQVKPIGKRSYYDSNSLQNIGQALDKDFKLLNLKIRTGTASSNEIDRLKNIVSLYNERAKSSYKADVTRAAIEQEKQGFGLRSPVPKVEGIDVLNQRLSKEFAKLPKPITYSAQGLERAVRGLSESTPKLSKPLQPYGEALYEVTANAPATFIQGGVQNFVNNLSPIQKNALRRSLSKDDYADLGLSLIGKGFQQGFKAVDKLTPSERVEANAKLKDVLAQTFFTLPTLATGGELEAIGLPKAAALLRGFKTAQVVTSPEPVSTASAYALGAGIGAGAKSLERYESFAKAIVGKSDVGKFYVYLGRIGNKTVPLYFTAELVKQAPEFASKLGTKEFSRFARQTSAEFVALAQGSKVGEFVGTRATNPAALLGRKIEIRKNLVKDYGLNSKEVKVFDSAYQQAFKKLDKNFKPRGEYDLKYLEGLQSIKNPLERKKAANVIVKTLQEHSKDNVLIGSEALFASLGIEKLPRGLIGDVDSKGLVNLTQNYELIANDLKTNLNKAGFKSELTRTVKDGFPEYYVKVNGKIIFNSHDLRATTLADLEEVSNVFESPATRESRFVETKKGLNILNLRDQLRRKLFAYRAKDIPDIEAALKKLDPEGYTRIVSESVSPKLNKELKAKSFSERLKENVNEKQFYKEAKSKDYLPKNISNYSIGKINNYFAKQAKEISYPSPYSEKTVGKYIKSKPRIYLGKQTGSYPKGNKPEQYPSGLYNLKTGGTYTIPQNTPYIPQLINYIPKNPGYNPPYSPPKTPPYLPPTKPPKQPPTVPPSTKKFNERLEKVRKSPMAFNVLVRQNKKYVKLNKNPLTKVSALNLGHRFVENTPTRTLLLSSVKGIPTSIRGLQSIKINQYRVPKGRSRIPRIALIEKNKYLINTQGEKRGITLKGVAARIRNSQIRRALNPSLLTQLRSVHPKVLRRQIKIHPSVYYLKRRK